jgi:membrane protease YdiL (CAAX protease family)
MFSKLRTALFPASKLSDTFPWTVQTAGKNYFVALLHFTVGSFAVPLLFCALMLWLGQFPEMLAAFKHPSGIARLLCGTAIGAALAAAVFNALRLSLVAADKIRARTIAAWKTYAAIGFFSACALPVAVRLFAPHYMSVLEWVFGFIAEPGTGQPKMSFVMGLSFLSFVMGFGMQVRYIASQLSKEGISFRKAMALTLEPLKGSWWGATAFKLIVPVLVAYGLTQLIALGVVAVMGSAHQPTVDLAQKATGGNFVLFALMAVVGAPVFEELVFRGFLYQVIRCSLKREPKAGTIGGFIVRVFGGDRSELSAIVLSSVMFSLMHMQFQPTTMVLLFLLGVVQAEIFRRTGSLYSGMLLHALNNGLEVLKLALGQV